jgi:hypothetical protein
VLADSTTDHRPVITTIASGGSHKPLTKLSRRPFKAIRREALELALRLVRNWSGIYAIKDVEEVHKFITGGIITALDAVAPVKEIVVKTGSNLYLTRETLEMMRRRDAARAGMPRYRALRNAANRLLKRDKLASNTETLSKASSDPRVLWQLANDALGKAPASLPPALVNAAGNMTSGKREAAETINAFFISKVDSLRAASESPASDTLDSATDALDFRADPANMATAVPNSAAEVTDKARDSANKPSFAFTFATAGKIAKIIRGLKAMEAMGIDHIPTSVLKKGLEVLAGPISHLVNRSLAEGRVPEAFKVGKVFPIFKGKGTAREDPASYRPVLILPAMSKILEKSVKADLEDHLARVTGLLERSTATGQRGPAPQRWHRRTPGGSPAPRGGRSLASWPLTCPPPLIRWRPSSSSQSSSRWEGLGGLLPGSSHT